MWPLQPAFDTARILLQEEADDLYRVCISYCERRSAGGGSLTSTIQPIYNIIRSDGMPHFRALPHRWTAAHCRA